MSVPNAITPIYPAPEYREGDVFFCSYPKSGRTWVKQFLAQYMSELFSLGYRKDYDLMSLMAIVPSEWKLAAFPTPFPYGPEVPRVRFSHTLFDDRYVDMPVIRLKRGIEDTLVSYYYHTPKDVKIGPWARSMVHEVIYYYKNWDANWSRVGRGMTLSYEDLWEDAKGSFHAILDFIGLPFDSKHFYAALERASFDQMQKEDKGIRVRRGVVGGYKDELSPEDIAFIQERING